MGQAAFDDSDADGSGLFDDLDKELDLIPSLAPAHGTKGSAVPLKRTRRQVAAQQQAEEAKDLAAAGNAAKAQAARLAQVVNLTIAGFSFEDIGASIGATAKEVEDMLTKDTQRYVKTQPALRVWVRNFVSGKYLGLLDAVYDEATDTQHGEKLENSLQALRILKEMAHLHGANMPTQTEVKVDAAPEAVERMVQALAAGKGLGYDTSVFDVVPGAVVKHDLADADAAETVSGNAVGEPDEDDDEFYE